MYSEKKGNLEEKLSVKLTQTPPLLFLKPPYLTLPFGHNSDNIFTHLFLYILIKVM